jgi:ComF family protein
MSAAGRLLSTLRFTADALVCVTLAPNCAACGTPLRRPLGGPVCDGCWASIEPPRPPLCVICGEPLPSWRVLSIELSRCARCRRRPPAVDRSASAGSHTGPLREIIHALKFQRRRSLAPRLARLMAQAGADLLAGADIVVPVPLHPWRRFHRGFNQAGDLAAALPLPVAQALRRQRATPSQTGLTAAARRRNVRGAFAISRLASRRLAIRGRIVLLVDDVMTTGATLDACARVLKEEGAREVWALTAARR